MRTEGQNPVSARNPCPLLRALVSEGLLSDLDEPLGHLASTVREVARTGDGEPELAYGAIVLIALIANGLNPLQLARTARSGPASLGPSRWSARQEGGGVRHSRSVECL
jgi:hypothetical protein